MPDMYASCTQFLFMAQIPFCFSNPAGPSKNTSKLTSCLFQKTCPWTHGSTTTHLYCWAPESYIWDLPLQMTLSPMKPSPSFPAAGPQNISVKLTADQINLVVWRQGFILPILVDQKSGIDSWQSHSKHPTAARQSFEHFLVNYLMKTQSTKPG